MESARAQKERNDILEANFFKLDFMEMRVTELLALAKAVEEAVVSGTWACPHSLFDIMDLDRGSTYTFSFLLESCVTDGTYVKDDAWAVKFLETWLEEVGPRIGFIHDW